MLVSPGDNVLVESPTYSGALASVNTFAIDKHSSVTVNYCGNFVNSIFVNSSN